MTKSELIDLLSAEQNQLGYRDVELAVKVILESLTSALSSGERIEVRGFGSFIIKKRAKKIGRHIKKNIAIEIPEHYIPAFKPAKIFVEQVKDNVTAVPDDEAND